MNRPIRALALTSYPVESAASRFRVIQLTEALAQRGIDLTVRPFIDSPTYAGLYVRRRWPRSAEGVLWGIGRRVVDVASAAKFDVVIVQREAAFFGPPVTEWILHRLRKRPIVLDLDDATWVAYDSPTYGRVAGILKPESKTDRLIRAAAVVTCGSHAIVEHVESLGASTVYVPTVVDLDRFRPKQIVVTDRPVIGWIGSHSTWQYLEPLVEVIARVSEAFPVRVLIVGHGRGKIALPNDRFEARQWQLATEADDYRSLDIGLYPITPGPYSSGKSGFKAVAYMSCGVPFVASPIGEAATIGEPGVTHLLAESPDEWFAALSRLAGDAGLRRSMGEAGRAYAESHFGIVRAVEPLADAIRRAARSA